MEYVRLQSRLVSYDRGMFTTNFVCWWVKGTIGSCMTWRISTTIGGRWRQLLPERHRLVSRWLVVTVFISASAGGHAKRTVAHVSKTTESVLQRVIVTANAVRIMIKCEYGVGSRLVVDQV